MKKIIAPVLITVMLFCLIVPVYAGPASVSITRAEINGHTGVVTVEGTISSGEGKNVTIRITYPDGNLYLNQTTSTEGGYFIFQYKMSSVQYGTYNVEVGGEGVPEPAAATFVNQQQGNSPPVLNFIGNKSADENTLLTFTINATDADGDVLEYTAENLPDGAVFDAGSGTFSWTPTYAQAGTYIVRFIVTDGVYTVYEDVEIVVSNVNRPPVLESIGNKYVYEGEELSFIISATDPDGDTLTYSTGELPRRALFNAENRKFSWIPDNSQSGTYTVRFMVSDGYETVYEDILIRVYDASEDYPPESDDEPEEEEKPATDKSIDVYLNELRVLLSDGISQDEESTVTGLFTHIRNGIHNAPSIIEAVNIFEKVIDTIAEVSDKHQGTSAKMLSDEIAMLFEEVIQKAGRAGTATINQNGTATSEIREAMLGAILARAESAVKTADSLVDIMKKAGFDIDAKKKVIFKVLDDENTTGIKVTLPADLFRSVKEKGIDQVEITSGMVTLKVAADFIKLPDEAEKITLSVSKAELNEALLAGLSGKQKELIEAGAVVYDLNLEILKPDGTGEKVSKFDNKITVSIPYTLKDGEDPDKVTILYLADNGEIKNMCGKYDPASGFVSFETKHFSKYIAKHVSITFTDVAGDFWAKDFIEKVAAKGIINGVSGKEYVFAPDRNVTRAEYVKMIIVAKGLLDEHAVCPYNDVQADRWYAPYIASAYKAGIITIGANGKFRPEEDITREEMAVMVSRALNLKKPSDRYPVVDFADKALISEEAVSDVAAVVQAGIMNGKPGKIFDPSGFTKRAEAAKTIYLLYKY